MAPISTTIRLTFRDIWGQTVTLRFYFDTLDNFANNSEGWYVDDVKVTCEINPDAPIDLSINKIVNNDSPSEGDSVTFTLDVVNTSTSTPATGVLVHDLIPAGLTYISDIASQGDYDESRGIWNVGTILTSSANATLNITVSVDDGTATSSITNTGCITALDQVDQNASNDCDTANIDVISQYSCGGFTATIEGTADDDDIVGTSGRDVIVGLGGNDTIFGQSGSDIICGNDGNDTIYGNKGKDKIYGGDGKDTLNGGSDDDKLFGGSGAYILKGSGGNDILKGQGGSDELIGNAGDDTLKGGGGIDSHNYGTGIDTAIGGPGADTAKPSCESISGIP